MVISLLQVPHKLIYYIHCNRKLERERAVNIIKLPPVLPSDLDLTVINQRLQAGEATLNWSIVKEAPEDHLAVLLAGMDLVEHSEVLGIETVPDHLAEVVLRALLGPESQSPRRKEYKQPADNNVASVAWEPEQQVDLNGIAPLVEVELPRTTQILLEPPRSILQALSPSALRDELERLVLQDLLGPAGGPEEEIDEGSVRDRYLVGALAPGDQQVIPEEMDELPIPEEGSVEDEANDDGAVQIPSLYPSSIGMSFSVDGTATSLSVEASWGSYKREHSETIKTPKGSPKMVWKRQQIGERSKIFPLKEGPVPPWSPEAYALSPEHEQGPMAGILLYTAASDSEGTLGGLVGLGMPNQLGRHLDGALERTRSCTSDPLCAEHTGLQDTSLHEAACHACLFLPETSCERGNKYLDRSVLVPTVDRIKLAFFEMSG
jgi:hypothetical protein